MNIKEASSAAISKLATLYGDREAHNVVSILLEDAYGVTNLTSEKTLEDIASFNEDIERLLRSEPVQYVTGRADFFGYKFKVNKHVLIPRPETEELVHWILQDLKNQKKQVDLLDIGVGSGCIPITIGKKYKFARLCGIDYNMDTLNVARINSKNLGVPMTLYNLDVLDRSLWDALGRFDIIVSNPPYMDEKDRQVMADNVLLYEPEKALFAGDDKFVFYKAIEELATKCINLKGAVYLEIHEGYAADVIDIFRKEGRQIDLKKDLQGKDRMVKVQF